ncbi:hypothetical protein BT63DRAFT_438112 [Microthyrium microscopicum]|uniref:Concanavalin A-like lectin/glucanase n=1 Tax=Microthyrium microscopicum TaxID=703497 RepID=A0A6A6UKR4_9PEZI|nr:hypothetical protein BT63DRAFT_438112 [Microthyrium microscopicum]
MQLKISCMLAALLIAGSKASPFANSNISPRQEKVASTNVTLGSTGGESVEGYFVAAYSPGDNIDNVEWIAVEDPQANLSASETRCIDCVCTARSTVKYKTLSHGTWWTPWCHDRRAVTPDGIVLIGEAKGTSVTMSAELKVSVPKLADALELTLGYSVTKTKSVIAMQGCKGDPSWKGPHGVWWQEKMGWAKVQQDTEITWEGGRNWFVAPEPVLWCFC